MDPVNLCYLGFPYPHWNSNGSLMDIDFFIITWLGGGGRGILKQGPGLGGSWAKWKQFLRDAVPKKNGKKNDIGTDRTCCYYFVTLSKR